MNKNLHIAIHAAISAGQEIIKIYETKDFGVEMKSDNTPLTKADQAAHRIIVSHLENTDIPILSEEGLNISYPERANWNTFWLVDPLDGTKEFIKRNGEFTVNIALIENQSPCAGVVYVPVTKELYFADSNGAFKTAINEDMDASISKAVKLPTESNKREYVVLASKSHRTQETEDYIASIELNNKPLKLISKGSSLKICLVAEGKADCYPRLGPTMEWDTAAGHAIAKFAGKSITTYPEKREMIYNKENLLNPYFIVE